MTSQGAHATLFATASKASPRTRARYALRVAEEAVAALALGIALVLLLVEIVFRPWYGYVIPSSPVFVRQLTMWVALLGAALAARDGQLLSLATVEFLPAGLRRGAALAAAAAGAAVTAILCAGAVALVLDEREMGTRLGWGLDAWMSQLVLPIGFGAIAVRLVLRAAPTWAARSLAATGLAAGVAIALRPAWLEGSPASLWVAVMMLAGAVGAPLFVVLGGLAVFLFLSAGIPPPNVVASAYELTTNPTLPAVPLFTLAGFILSEGDTPQRLLRLYRGWLGWLPGGTAIACVMVSAFFTIFTGGSGVTILALGGLLLPALLRDGYPDRFSVGLLTASGSLGLLLPPALPLILYAIVAEISVTGMMVGGILPGVLMIGLAAAHGIRRGVEAGVERPPFRARDAASATWHAKWEVLLPAVVLGTFFGGYATIVDTAAIAVVYALVVQVFIHRNIAPAALRRVLAQSVATIGGVLIILAVARGLGSFLIDAGIPAQLIAWTRTYVDNKYVFLMALNLFLLAVGCLMDIYSATFVVAPLIAPLGAEFGIHPIHLGMIFIANLELGYLTPPVGLNLFLSSYRFNRPLLDVARASLPMLLILGGGVVLITYLPWLTTALLPLVQEGP